MLPAFNQDGNLPEGLHQANEKEVLARFATPSVRRQWLGEQFRQLLNAATATGSLRRVILWGSFVTNKESPNDIDVLLIMDEGFDSEQVLGDTKILLPTLRPRFDLRRMSFGRKLQ